MIWIQLTDSPDWHSFPWFFRHSYSYLKIVDLPGIKKAKQKIITWRET